MGITGAPEDTPIHRDMLAHPCIALSSVLWGYGEVTSVTSWMPQGYSAKDDGEWKKTAFIAAGFADGMVRLFVPTLAPALASTSDRDSRDPGCDTHLQSSAGGMALWTLDVEIIGAVGAVNDMCFVLHENQLYLITVSSDGAVRVLGVAELRKSDGTVWRATEYAADMRTMFPGVTGSTARYSPAISGAAAQSFVGAPLLRVCASSPIAADRLRIVVASHDVVWITSFATFESRGSSGSSNSSSGSSSRGGGGSSSSSASSRGAGGGSSSSSGSSSGSGEMGELCEPLCLRVPHPACAISAIAMIPTGKLLAVGLNSGVVLLYDVERAEKLQACCVKLFTDAKQAVTHNPMSLMVPEVLVAPVVHGSVTALEWSMNGTHLAVGVSSGVVVVWKRIGPRMYGDQQRVGFLRLLSVADASGACGPSVEPVLCYGRSGAPICWIGRSDPRLGHVRE